MTCRFLFIVYVLFLRFLLRQWFKQIKPLTGRSWEKFSSETMFILQRARLIKLKTFIKFLNTLANCRFSVMLISFQRIILISKTYSSSLSVIWLVLYPYFYWVWKIREQFSMKFLSCYCTLELPLIQNLAYSSHFTWKLQLVWSSIS